MLQSWWSYPLPFEVFIAVLFKIVPSVIPISAIFSYIIKSIDLLLAQFHIYSQFFHVLDLQKSFYQLN